MDPFCWGKMYNLLRGYLVSLQLDTESRTEMNSDEPLSLEDPKDLGVYLGIIKVENIIYPQQCDYRICHHLIRARYMDPITNNEDPCYLAISLDY